MDIKWEKFTSFLGRNGTGKCSGVWVGDYVEGKKIIEPFTSKGSLARCQIIMPDEEAKQVGSALLYGDAAGGADLLRLALDQIDPKELPNLLGLNPALDEFVAQRLK